MLKRRFVFVFFLCNLVLNFQSRAACGHYLHLHQPPTPQEPIRGAKKNIEEPPSFHYEKIQSALERQESIEGLIKFYSKPIPLDFMFEIFAESYPRGEEYGALWHIRPRKTAYDLIEAEAENYIKLETESDDITSRFFEYFHRTLKVDDKIGTYWSARESPELFETLKKEWNYRSRWTDEIYLGVRTTGADRQMAMARLRAEKNPVAGVATPQIAVSHIVTASGIPNIEEPDLKIDPATGRITQYSSLAAHDWRELDSAVWISGGVAQRMRQVSRLWLEIHSILKNSKSFTKNKNAKKTSKEFQDFAKFEAEKGSVALNSGRGFTKDGAYWWRLAEIEIYRSQRVFHSFNHLLSELIRRPKGISLADVVKRYGPIHEREFPLHLGALGVAVGSPPQNLSPLVKLTYVEGNSNKALTLEAAIERLYKYEDLRIINFSKKVPDYKVKKLIQSFLYEYPEMDGYWIKRMADEQRQRFESMGMGSNIRF